MARLWFRILLVSGLLAPWGAECEPVMHARIDRAVDAYEVKHDLTFVLIRTSDYTLFTDRALHRQDRATVTFHPDSQVVEVVEAWVDQPDGARVQVAKSNIFTRPSEAARSAPGFTNSQTTTVLFPQLRRGSHTHVVWRIAQTSHALLGFNLMNVNNFNWDTVWDETVINVPADVPLRWVARGGFVVKETVEAGTRHISAHIEATRGREEEPAMVNQYDFMPLFLVTSLPNPEAIGAIIHRFSEDRSKVTPEIAALAARIAADRTGLDSARAIHDWVASNIRYVALRANSDDGFIPRAAAAVLKTGYGDCKDFVTLMQALLAARGIEGQMAFVDWGNKFAELPLWTPYLFNHAIFWLPQYDHYLNPTDRNAGFDALDRRLSGKPVVFMTKEGRVGRTPPSTPEDNRYRYVARLTLGADGTIDGTADFAMAPNEEIPVRNALRGASSMTDMAERRLVNTPEGGFGEFVASDPQDLLSPLKLSASWHSPLAVNVQERDTFLRVPTGLDMYPLTQLRGKLTPAGKRQTPLEVGVTDAGWETLIKLPSGMLVARLPADVDLETPIGHYTARYRRDDENIVVSRNLVIRQHVVPPETYPELERLIYASLVDARAIIVLSPTVQ